MCETRPHTSHRQLYNWRTCLLRKALQLSVSRLALLTSPWEIFAHRSMQAYRNHVYLRHTGSTLRPTFKGKGSSRGTGAHEQVSSREVSLAGCAVQHMGQAPNPPEGPPPAAAFLPQTLHQPAKFSAMSCRHEDSCLHLNHDWHRHAFQNPCLTCRYCVMNIGQEFALLGVCSRVAVRLHVASQ